ncbi:hypothetical protein ACO1O0_002219 [Amphichorda felina]
MASLPAQHPDLSLHLTDSTLTPLITSSSSPSHLDSLTSLASTALTSHSAVARVNLGTPQRIMVEYPDRGAVVLQSYIDPQPPQEYRQQQLLLQSHQQKHHNHGPSPPPSRQPSRPVSSRADRHQPLVQPSPLPTTPTTLATTGGAQIDPEDAPPRLVGVVVAGSADQTREARRAAARLERVGRDFQREWWATESSRVSDEEGAA